MENAGPADKEGGPGRLVPGSTKAVALTSYQTSIYELTVWVKVTMLVVLMDDGSLWEKRAGPRRPWTHIETPR